MKKGIYILPNLFTLGNLSLGFYSIICSLNGNFEYSAYFVLIAMLFDVLDGKIARMTNTMSKFGVEFDSLADLVSFCVAPSLILYMFALNKFGRIGWVLALLYLSCGALRLARFNVQSGGTEKTNFTGLPTPAAAGVMVCYILVAVDRHWLGHKILLPVLVILISYLMVSNLSYFSLKKFNLKGRKPFGQLIVVVLIGYIIMLNPEVTIFSLILAYASSGIIGTIFFGAKFEYVLENFKLGNQKNSKLKQDKSQQSSQKPI